jgi:urease accessory protein
LSWHAGLQLRVRRDGARCITHARHEGPLRVLKTLHPEGDGICHEVLVHPPGGIVGGDQLEIELAIEAQAHALITTPGATRFYRSAGDDAQQCLQARVDDGARLEWLPLETIAYSGCRAENRLRFELARGAEMIGWDLLALGLPAADAAFEQGWIRQHLELPGVWLERGAIAAADQRLLNSPLGLAGHRVIATLWFAGGASLDLARREGLVDGARSIVSVDALAASCGVTATHPQTVVLRLLAPRVEPAMQLLVKLWSVWRQAAWGIAACAPRVWST